VTVEFVRPTIRRETPPAFVSSAAGPIGSKFSHLDLVVSDLERSLAFYAGLLEPLGWTRVAEIDGEAGERVVYRSVPGSYTALGLREKRSDAHGRAVRPLRGRPAPRSASTSPRARWWTSGRRGCTTRARKIEGGPREYDYTPGYSPCSSSIPTGSSSSCCTDRWSSPVASLRRTRAARQLLHGPAGPRARL